MSGVGYPVYGKNLFQLVADVVKVIIVNRAQKQFV